jgi:hypothetical protein
LVRMTVTLLALSAALLTLLAMGQNNNESPAGLPVVAKPPSQPESGKALVYFIEDDSTFNSSPKPTTRAGIDGNWVGVTHYKWRRGPFEER